MATLSIKEVAVKFDTTPRTLRKYLRRAAVAQGGTIGVDTPGKGGRYAFEAKQLRTLRKGFDAWIAANAAKADVPLESTESDIAPDEANEEVAETE